MPASLTARPRKKEANSGAATGKRMVRKVKVTMQKANLAPGETLGMVRQSISTARRRRGMMRTRNGKTA